MPNHESSLNTVFQALADPTRRAVIQRLTQGPATVKELAQPFDMALPSFLQHLKVLEVGGIIKSKKNGRVRTCEIKQKEISKAEQWLAEQRTHWEDRLDRLGAYLNELQKAKR